MADQRGAVPFLHGVSSGTVEASAVTAFVKQSSGARVMPAPIWPACVAMRDPGIDNRENPGIDDFTRVDPRRSPGETHRRQREAAIAAVLAMA